MRRLRTVLVLSTFCLAASACGDRQRVATAITPPADRMDCRQLDGAEGRPTIPPEYVIDWTRVRTVQQAREQHQAFVSRLRERESAVAGYVVRLEGRVFACSDDAAWLRQFFAALPSASED